jgi:co-chaperonin GroES (HSP10)
MEDSAMKSVILVAVAVVAVSSIPLVAQNAAANAQQNASASTQNAQVNESASGSAKVNREGVQANSNAAGSAAIKGPAGGQSSTNAAATAAGQMRPVNGELVGKLDSKSAKVGERVVVKTNEKVRTASGIVIPKGSRLIGRVTEVQAHGSGHADSSMGLEFDQAELKNGQDIAIHSVIESVAPPANAVASMSNDDSLDAPMAPMGGGGRMVGGGGVRGGGLVGGTLNGATSATGRVGSDFGSTAGGTLQTTGNLSGNTTANVGNGLRGETGANGMLGLHATAIHGLMLDSSATGSASGVLSASKRNIHLDSGTQMVLGVAAAGKI